jgi:hypothetical protein
MVYRERYTSPFRTVQLIERQASAHENVNFANKYFGNLNNGFEIYKAVKPKVIFKNDPPNLETVQGITTLFDESKNIHGISGAGDCDCFTSILASIAKANKLPYTYILQGNEKPTHITISIKGTVCDLTNNIPNYLRPYTKTQTIEPMYVQLSDEPAYALSDFGRGGRGKEKVKRFAKNYGKYVVGATAIGASLLIPGSGKIIKAAYNKVPGLLKKGAQLINTNKATISTASNFLRKNNITPGAIPQGNLPVTLPNNEENETQSNASGMPEYTYPGPTITAQKINPLLIVGGLAIAYFLFNKKR